MTRTQKPGSHTLHLTMVLTMLGVASLPAQGSWSQTPTTGTTPRLIAHAAVYDLARERVVTFGGFDPAVAPQATTTLFDGQTWTQAATLTAPPARVGHAMTYDITRDRVVLFGGVDSLLGAPMDDTWEFDGVDWTQCFPAHAPQLRMDHAMVFDVACQGALLFGGRTQWQSYGDTWLWDGTDWTQLAISGPSPRHGHAMSCDWARGRTVLFGGFANGVVGDTWEWNGSSWSQAITAVAPPARSNHGMAFDFSRGVTVLHGGAPAGNATWEWDGTAWTQHGSTVRSRSNHALVYDARLQRTTAVGGLDSYMIFHDEVETYGHALPGSLEVLGASCAGSASTAQLFPVTSLTSGPMIGQTAVVQIRETWFHSLFVFGWSDSFDGNTPLPHDLAAYGMPGCSMQVSGDAVVSVLPDNGVATMAMSIPNDPFLVGTIYFIQGLSLDPLANSGGYTTTNRIKATVGRN